MRIKDYFHQIQNILDSISCISIQSITFDERSEYIGYVKGRIDFADGSHLYISEYVDVEHIIDKLKYSYHLICEGQVLIRYDNASDPHAKRLRTFPHHKHTLNGELVESNVPELEEVLKEAKNLLKL
jgi:hypothetical protein